MRIGPAAAWAKDLRYVRLRGVLGDSPLANRSMVSEIGCFMPNPNPAPAAYDPEENPSENDFDIMNIDELWG